LHDRLKLYGESRNEPEKKSTSGLSLYLHFGHLSVHEIFSEIAELEKWNPSKLHSKASGKREGFWGMGKSTENFLDELVTWRELGFHFCAHRKDYDQFDSLPEWALKTLKKHSKDKRIFIYSLEEFEQAKTHDSLWNAAQSQLLKEGIIHNYLRMLWGKKILEWSPSPEEALKTLIELNNKYALDGRNPNSYTGIFWVLGRFDHPWPPERPVFGTVRYMSSQNTAKKMKVKNYIEEYSTSPHPSPS
jgi:deoxyribodipyrimidine photo-lyase